MHLTHRLHVADKRPHWPASAGPQLGIETGQIAPPRGLLLVDDHTIIREGIKRILEPLSAHWSITEADSGYRALEYLRKQAFLLAIVDLSLPGLDCEH